MARVLVDVVLVAALTGKQPVVRERASAVSRGAAACMHALTHSSFRSEYLIRARWLCMQRSSSSRRRLLRRGRRGWTRTTRRACRAGWPSPWSSATRRSPRRTPRAGTCATTGAGEVGGACPLGGSR